LGDLHRKGEVFSKQEIASYDHDFSSLSTGVAIPHGIFDIQKNKAHVSIGTSHDTSEFACDSIEQWWNNEGKKDYAQATSILILADGGGSNSSRSWLFKEKLQKLSNKIGLKIRVAHYPPYTSKWNPIEHRLFSYISKSIQGVLLHTLQQLKELIETTTTGAGLKVKATILNKIYRTGEKVTEGFKESSSIISDDAFPKWNYIVTPELESS